MGVAVSCPASVRVHGKQLDVLRVPVEAYRRVVDQRPDVRDEELLRLLFLHIFEFQFWKFLQ